LEFRIVYNGTEPLEAARLSEAVDESFAVIYCEIGYGVAYIGGERAELTPGHAIMLVQRGKTQGITLSDDFGGRFFVCEGTLARALFGYYSEGREFFVTDLLARGMSELIFSFKEESPYTFHTLLREMKTKAPQIARTGIADVAAIKEYIDTHTEKKITLELLSARFFISKTQIHRLFIAHYGISPMKYMLKTKIERSKELLSSTDLKISEIAERLSFTDSKHYTKTFRNFTGMLPSEYRKQE